MADLSNKRIVVTGGSAGIGLAIVSALREAQAEVTAIARNEARLAAAREIGAHCVAGDATDATPTERDPDVLILNAGAQPAMGKTVCPPLPVRWLALHCASEGCSGGPSRSSPQEDEPWRIIEKHLSESMLRS
ncbi:MULTISPECIES: SDR family NAD(P)-dependent oxidoreductase [unclassified Mesorhizobium]|uniref:SDR family NAD(P)-dependent oxidoreductase n=1 Tax=unclassified Mesorhizobium TaxID=325217 RepID=UPI0019D14751|nr:MULTISPECIES: SDR family NAD(P)-dependent oxidoreductase [unclassified Mesorhizobium]